jgi:glycosyltransferase involved in cell wall biosynthesis
MRACVTLEHRYFGTPDGRTWTITQFPYEFFKNYLDVFDGVRVIARVFPVPRVETGFRPVDGPGVEVFAMPPYKGPFEFAGQFARVRERAKAAVTVGDAVILRVHSQVANSVERWLVKSKQPFALEVVSDPLDVLSFSAYRHPVAPIARLYFAGRLKSQCRRAMAVSYVTREALQQHYPPDRKHYCTNYSSVSLRPDSFAEYQRAGRQFATSFSDVELSKESFTATERPACAERRLKRLITIGSLESLGKGTDTLLDALTRCKREGVCMELVVIGSGKYQKMLQEKCERLGIQGQVRFTGSLPVGEAVRRELDSADLFVLPSRAEGLPRAMLEAMARGIPCIGSAVGGIPELLSKDDLVTPGNPKALATKLMSVVSDESRLAEMAARGLRVAESYSADKLQEKRHEFYATVKALTAAHYEIPYARATGGPTVVGC